MRTESLDTAWRWPRWVAAFITLIGAGFQIWQWTVARSLWLDEEMIAINLRERGLVDLAGRLWLGQSAPLGWLASERAVVLVFGTSERALRFVPMLFGIGTLAIAFWVGRRWMGPVGAAVLALLCCLGQWIAFQPLELKPYSADAFWGLLLPALAAWAMEPPVDGSRHSTRRVIVWWTVAAVGQLFGNGALLVTPACALVLFAAQSRRGGWRGARSVLLPGLAWLAFFGLHYFLAIRHTLDSEYLREYWAFALPPASSGWIERLRWLSGQFAQMALKPGGSGRWLMFWVLAAAGIAFLIRTRPTWGLMLAMVPLTACTLAVLRLVPMSERLSLWVVPTLYVGIAVSADSVVRLGRRAFTHRRPIDVALALVGGFAVITLCADVSRRGAVELAARFGWGIFNHKLDDRGAMRWLMAQRRPGDALMSTYLGLPAVWWYGRVPMSGPDPADDRHDDGGAIFQVTHEYPGPKCDVDQERIALADQGRVILYLGFRFDDVPKGFDDLLFDRLGRLGSVVAYRSFGDISRAAVIDLRLPPTAGNNLPGRPGALPADILAEPKGCLGVKLARRW